MIFDRPFPTMVIGSLPRPRWVLDLIEAREQDSISEQDFNHAVEAGLRFTIALQEQAGIDIITDGEWRRRTYFTGFAQAVEGFQKDVIVFVQHERGCARPGISGR